MRPNIGMLGSKRHHFLGGWSRSDTQQPVSRPEAPSPRDETMPTEAPMLLTQTCLAVCIVHRDLPVGALEADVKVNGKPFWAILYSGSVVTLVQSHILALRKEYKN